MNQSKGQTNKKVWSFLFKKIAQEKVFLRMKLKNCYAKYLKFIPRRWKFQIWNEK